MQTTEHTTPTTGRAFDSLAYAKHMEAVGFTRQQAEALAEEQGKLIDERLATKADLTLVRADLAGTEARLRAEIAQFKIEIEAKIIQSKTELEAKIITTVSDSKSEILKWMFASGTIQVLVIIGTLVSLLHGVGRM